MFCLFVGHCFQVPEKKSWEFLLIDCPILEELLILISTLDFMYWINNSWYLTAIVFQHRKSSDHVFLNDFICDTLKFKYGMCFVKFFINFQPGNVSYHVFQSIYALNFDVPIRSVFFYFPPFLVNQHGNGFFKMHQLKAF